MKKIFFILIFLFISVGVEAEEIYPEYELKEIRVVEIGDETAYLQGPDGTVTEIGLGDQVGQERGEVVEIGEAWVTIQIGSTRTRLLVIQGFEG